MIPIPLIILSVSLMIIFILMFIAMVYEPKSEEIIFNTHKSQGWASRNRISEDQRAGRQNRGSGRTGENIRVGANPNRAVPNIPYAPPPPPASPISLPADKSAKIMPIKENKKNTVQDRLNAIEEN